MDIANFISCAQALSPEISVLVRGNHGIGKSQVVRQIADHFKLPVIDKRLSQMSEGDMIGLPELVDGATRFAHPDWFVEACKRPMCLFLDEFNRALPEVMQAAFQIVLDRELNGLKLHPDTRVFAAINNAANYQVNEMDPALLDRFWVIDLEPTTKDWLNWAKNVVHPYLYEFCAKHETRLDPSAKVDPGKKQQSRRTWHRLDSQLNAAGLFDKDLKTDKKAEQLFYSLTLGFLGTETAQEFTSFVKNIDKQVSAEDILNNFEKNRKRILDLGQDKWNICIEKVVDFGKKTIFTKSQAENVGKFVEVLPGELRVSFWAQMAQVGTEQSAANIKVMHDYVMPHLLATFGKKAPVKK